MPQGASIIMHDDLRDRLTSQIESVSDDNERKIASLRW